MTTISPQQKKEFLEKQLEILRKKATDMTIGNYMTLQNYYSKKLDRLDSAVLPPFDNVIPSNLEVECYGSKN